MKFLFKNGDNGYWKRIRNVAEKLHKKADALRDKSEYYRIIPWDIFLLDYMKDNEPQDDLEQRLYVEKRSNMWKDDVNSMFTELGYPEWLFVESTVGVKLVVDAFAARKLQLEGLKKECSITDRRSKKLKQFSTCFTGRIKKELERMSDMNLSMLSFLAGQIALDPKLPKKQKEELLGIIKCFVPEDEEDEE